MHDYFYHNLGQSMTLTAVDGTDMNLQPTEELAFAGADLYAYSYLYDNVNSKACISLRVHVNITRKRNALQRTFSSRRWAYSGAIDVSDCATAKEVMFKAGLNFNVAKCELVGKMPIKLTGTDEELDRIIKEQKEGAHVFGTDIYRKCDNAFATYRTDYNIPLGVVKSKYTIVQNNDAFNFFDDAIGKNSAIWQTAGFWGNGERIFVSAKLPNNILVKGDPVENYLVFTNTHDGSGGVKILFTPIRVICQNTLNAAIRTSSNYVSFRHTTSVHNKISVAQEILGISKIKSEEFGQYCNLLANIKVTDEDVIQFIGENLLTSDEIQRLKDTGHTIKDIAYRSGLALTDSKISSRKMNVISDTYSYYFDGPGQRDILGTAWGAVNAISGYYSNIDNIEGTKRFDSICYGDKSRKIENAFALAEAL